MKKDIKSIFSDNLKYYMNLKNENLTKLSDSINVAYSTVSDWQHGRKMPRSGSLELLADHYGINISDLTSFKEKSNDILQIDNSNSYNYFDTGISAGMLMEVDPFTKDDVQQITLSDVIMGKYAGDQDIIVSHVNGESMNRILPDKSLIAIKKFHTIDDLRDGDIVVFQDGGDMSVKRFYFDNNSRIVTFSPDSYDSSFRPINYRYEDFGNVLIVGKVVVYTVEI